MLRSIDEAALEELVIGSAILGAGGGGDPYIGMLLAREGIRAHGPIEVVGADDLPDDARVAFVAGMGAPGVVVEKLPRAQDYVAALELLERHVGYAFTHLAPLEAGGLNAITPLPACAARGLPLLDADGMGRAFPSLEMLTPTLHGAHSAPMSIVDEHGRAVIIVEATNAEAEEFARGIVSASGAVTSIACNAMSGAEAKRYLIRGVLSIAHELGGLVLRKELRDGLGPVEAIVARQDGVLLHEGKVTSIERRTESGWTIGEATIEGTGAHAGVTLELRFQNEHLVALRDGAIVATVPDLIMTLESESGQPIPAEELRYGYRISTVGMPCDDAWRSEAGLALTGPRRFGLDHDFTPIEARRA